MSSKLMNKKLFNKRIPLRTSFTQNRQILPSTSSSIYNAIGKQFSMEEYNKVMIQNQRLAKENAYLKSNFSSCKESLRLTTNETIELKQQLIVANSQIERLKTDLKNKNSSEITKYSDQLKNAAKLLTEDYLSIDEIKLQIYRLGERSQTVSGIISSLQSLMDGNNQLNENQNSDLNTERKDSYISFNTSMRYSLSSQDIDFRRRLSIERIRRDFHILSELSTIFETSTENRMSSLSSDGNNNSKNMNETINSKKAICALNNTLPLNEKTTIDNSTATHVYTHSGPSIPIKEKKAVNGTKLTLKLKAKKDIKTQNNCKTSLQNKITFNPRKQTKPKDTEIKFINKTNDSSVYEFTEEDENKENIVPGKPSQRFSRRTRNKKFSLK